MDIRKPSLLILICIGLLGNNNFNQTSAYFTIEQTMEQTNFSFMSVFGTETDTLYYTFLDEDGNIMLVGITRRTDFPVVNPIKDTNPNSEVDIFIMKTNPTGDDILFSTYFGGDDNDQLRDATFDHSTQELILVGTTYSNNFPIVNPLQENLNGTSDGFISIISMEHYNVVYSSYFGYGDDELYSDYIGKVATNPDGGLFFSGALSEPIFDPIQPILNNGNNGSRSYIAKFDGNRNIVYFDKFNENIQAGILDIDIINDSTLCLTSTVSSSNFPVSNPGQNVSNPSFTNPDIGVTILDLESKGIIFSSLYGGSHIDIASGTIINPEGTIYITGTTESTDFPVSNAFQESMGKAFLLSLNQMGDSLNSTYFGSSDAVFTAENIQFEDDGIILVSGRSSSPTFFEKSSETEGGYGYVARLDSDLSLILNHVIFDTPSNNFVTYMENVMGKIIVGVFLGQENYYGVDHSINQPVQDKYLIAQFSYTSKPPNSNREGISMFIVFDIVTPVLIITLYLSVKRYTSYFR